MRGFSFTLQDWIPLVVALVVTIYVVSARNPFPKDSRERDGLRFSRIGLALSLWAFDSGVIGIAFGVVAFILGILGIVKGHTAYGIVVIVLSVIGAVVSAVSLAAVLALFRALISLPAS